MNKTNPAYYCAEIEDGHFILHSPISNKSLVVNKVSKKILDFISTGSAVDYASIGYSEENILSAKDIFCRNGFLGLSNQTSSKKNGSVLSVWFHITNRCNLNCSYCFVRKSNSYMTLETARSALCHILKSCRKHSKTAKIIFSGGEPILEWEMIKEIINITDELRGGVEVKYALLTNGTLLSPNIANYISEKNIAVSVSLDGLGGINDATRGCGSFEATSRGLLLLKKHGIEPYILTTVTMSNVDHLLEYTKFILDKEYRFRFSLEKDLRAGVKPALESYSGLATALYRCYDYIESNLPKKNFFQLHQFCDVIFGRAVTRSCGAAENFFAVSQDGSLAVCGSGLSSPFGSLADLTNNKEDLLKYVREKNNDLYKYSADYCEVCRKCMWVSSCAGGCALQNKATYGHYKNPSIYCSIYKKIIPRILRIRGKQIVKRLKGGEKNER